MVSRLDESPLESPKHDTERPLLAHLLDMREQYDAQLKAGADVFQGMRTDLDEVLDEYKYELMGALDEQDFDAIAAAEARIEITQDSLIAIELLSDATVSFSTEGELLQAVTRVKLERATRKLDTE